MQADQQPISSWRQRFLASPLSASGSVPDGMVREETEETEETHPTRKGEGVANDRGNCEETAKKPPLGDPCVISGCPEPIADGDLVYCAGHRAGADDGSLWASVAVRRGVPFEPGAPTFIKLGPTTWIESSRAKAGCVFCGGPLAMGDPITCVEDRARLDGDLSATTVGVAA